MWAVVIAMFAVLAFAPRDAADAADGTADADVVLATVADASARPPSGSEPATDDPAPAPADLEVIRKNLRAGSQSGSVPEAYEALVVAAAATCPRLPVSMLAAQLRKESNWQPKAVSPVGAQGIAQFMPGTWKQHGLDGNGDGRRDPFDPRDAIPAAAAYDCHLLDEIADVPGDRLVNMLASYNAGPGAVRRYGGVPPYRETRHYVATIVRWSGHA